MSCLLANPGPSPPAHRPARAEVSVAQGVQAIVHFCTGPSNHAPEHGVGWKECHARRSRPGRACCMPYEVSCAVAATCIQCSLPSTRSPDSSAQHWRMVQLLRDEVGCAFEDLARFADSGQQCCRRHGQASLLANQLGGAGIRQQLALGQMHAQSAHVRPLIG